MEADTKAKYEELKSVYKSATLKSVVHSSVDRLESHEFRNVELQDKVKELQNEMSRLQNQVELLNSKLSDKEMDAKALELKMKTKKDKIKGL